MTLPPYMCRAGLDPAPELVELRDGVHRVRTLMGVDAWLVTAPSDVRMVLSDSARFSSERPKLPGTIPAVTPGNLLGLDPPDHTRLRRLLNGQFALRRIARLEPRITAIVDMLLDDFESKGQPGDLIEDFGLLFPSMVICELLGVPYADRGEFLSRTRTILDFTVPIEVRQVARKEGLAYMAELVAKERRDPGDELIGMMIREHDGKFTDEELVGTAELFLIAGHETTAAMFGLSVVTLLRHPDQLAAVRDDESAVGPAVEELLRWLSVAQSGAVRMTNTEVEIAGVRIPADDLVVVSLPMVNRDPSTVKDPDRFDITRGAPGHMAFGWGIHHCIGAPLVRAELRVALPALLRRFPGLALAVPEDELDYRTHSIAYGLNALPVTW